MPASKSYPIVLAHGIARFDIIRQLYQEKFGGELNDDNLHYFKSIRSHLQARGLSVYHTNVSFAADIATRSQELAGQINAILAQSHAPRVHLIAHSMGGLDARHLLVDIPGMTGKVASLTTIGTPHLGTIAADTAINLGGQTLIEALEPVLALSGYRDLTTTACREFNQRAESSEAANGVLYQTCASTQSLTSTFFAMHASWVLIKTKEGENDGLVSATSQAWASELTSADGRKKQIRQFQFPFPADHINQVGWWLPGNYTPKEGLLNISEQREKYERQVRDFYWDLARNLPTT